MGYIGLLCATQPARPRLELELVLSSFRPRIVRPTFLSVSTYLVYPRTNRLRHDFRIHALTSLSSRPVSRLEPSVRVEE